MRSPRVSLCEVPPCGEKQNGGGLPRRSSLTKPGQFLLLRPMLPEVRLRLDMDLHWLTLFFYHEGVCFGKLGGIAETKKITTRQLTGIGESGRRDIQASR